MAKDLSTQTQWECEIQFNDSEEIEFMTIALTDERSDEYDDNIFYYVDSYSELLELKLDNNGEDFKIVKIIN